MAAALICSQEDLQPELGHTVLWRTGIERHVATRLEDARTMAVAVRPDIVVVDRDLPGSYELIVALREDPGTRRVSIAIVDRKSTRLNSSHITISYAVFCLKKKNSTFFTPVLARSE